MTNRPIVIQRHSSRQTIRRGGTTLVEMALVLSVFFVMVMGFFEFGRSMMVNQILADATRRAGRLSVFDGTTNSEVTEFIQDFVATAAGVTGTDVNVTITVTAAPGNGNPGGQIANAEIGDLVTIQSQIDIDDVTWTPGSYLAGKKLTAIASMRHE